MKSHPASLGAQCHKPKAILTLENSGAGAGAGFYLKTPSCENLWTTATRNFVYRARRTSKLSGHVQLSHCTCNTQAFHSQDNNTLVELHHEVWQGIIVYALSGHVAAVMP